ncbi:MAG TPA: 50S ribosomal protein L18, partial [Saprospiraceae bacterium]|nr:50S ribosomal protein L18 [Saprospiraceae bacterium]
MKKTKEESRSRIHYRIRKKVAGSAERPRLSVFRSNKAIYAQLVDDTNGNVLTSASSALLETKSDNKVEQAKAVGKLIAEKAKDKNIDS